MVTIFQRGSHGQGGRGADVAGVVPDLSRVQQQRGGQLPVLVPAHRVRGPGRRPGPGAAPHVPLRHEDLLAQAR